MAMVCLLFGVFFSLTIISCESDKSVRIDRYEKKSRSRDEKSYEE